MRLVLEIKHEKDLKILLPLLERLKIRVAELPAMLTPKKNSNTGETPNQVPTEKNFDPEKMASLFEELKGMNAFSEITDPVAWQKQLRDEWN